MEPAQNVLSAQHWGVNDRMRLDSTTMASDGGGVCVQRTQGGGHSCLEQLKSDPRIPTQPTPVGGGLGGAGTDMRAVILALVSTGELTRWLTLGKSLALSGPPYL